MYPPIEPYDGGHLDVGDGHAVYWEVVGSPDGLQAIWLLGGRANRRDGRPTAPRILTTACSAGLAGHYHLRVARPVPENTLGRTVREQRPHLPGEAVKTITKQVRRRE
jgi:hypothetical protein